MKHTDIEIGKRYSCWLHDRDTVVEAIIVSQCASSGAQMTADLNADAPSPGGTYHHRGKVRICDGPQTGETAPVKSGDLKPLTQNEED